jgi:RHS repeat-associated protein
MSASSPSATVFSLNYDFRSGNGNNGNVFGIVNNKDNSRNQTFTYDALNRLISAQNAGTDCTKTLAGGKTEYWGNNYSYDAWGNLLAKSVTKCSAENLSLTALANNQLSGYGYDTAGNMTHDATSGHTYVYDAENRIASVDPSCVGTGCTCPPNGTVCNTFTAAYVYDDAGNRVEKWNSSTGTLYWYMSPGIVAESDLSGNLQSEYVFFDGERVARKDFPSGAVSYYFSDRLKTTDIVTDAQGNIKNESDFYPWGGELQFLPNDSNHYKYTGKERDNETGLDDMGKRFYSSGLGRFLSHDPIPTSGFERMHDPQAWNGYSYARNNPLRYVDPDGENYIVCQIGGGNCGDLTDEQYKQFLKDSPSLHTTAGGDIYVTNQDGSQTKVGTESYYSEKDFAAAQMLANTGRQLSDPRTIAAFYGVSALGGLGFSAAGAFEGGLTTLELTGAGEILSSQEAGQIIGWGTGQAGAEATKQLARSLTKKAVEKMIAKGLTKATVQRLLFKYGAAIAAGGAKLANTQLQPRYELMQKIVELWPK